MPTIQGFGRSSAQAQTQGIKERVKEIAGSMHPGAVIAWVVVAGFIICGLLYTGYHNYQLYRRGMGSDAFAGIVAFVPPLLLDGGIAVLLVLLLTYFKDQLQWYVAVGFNIALFIIVILNTSLNFSLNAGEQLTDGMRTYLHWGPLGAIVLALVMYELLIHLDPSHKLAQQKALITAKAAQEAHALEVKAIELDISEQQAQLDYEFMLREKMNVARLNAISSQDVDAALVDFEKHEAVERAKQIRQSHPNAQPNRP